MFTYEKASEYRSWVSISAGVPVERLKSMPINLLLQLYPGVEVSGPHPELKQRFVACLNRTLKVFNPEIAKALRDITDFAITHEKYLLDLAQVDPLRYVAVTADIVYQCSAIVAEHKEFEGLGNPVKIFLVILSSSDIVDGTAREEALVLLAKWEEALHVPRSW